MSRNGLANGKMAGLANGIVAAGGGTTMAVATTTLRVGALTAVVFPSMLKGSILKIVGKIIEMQGTITNKNLRRVVHCR